VSGNIMLQLVTDCVYGYYSLDENERSLNTCSVCGGRRMPMYQKYNQP